MKPEIKLLDETAFQAMLDDLGIAGAVHDYHTLSGLLLAVASAPDFIPPSEWMELIYTSDEPPALPDAASATVFMGHLMGHWNHWTGALGTEDEVLQLPAEYRLVDGNPTEAYSRFCRGLVMGYGWLEQDWSELIDALEDTKAEEELSAMFGATLISAMVIADPELPTRELEEGPEGEEVPDFPDLSLAAELLPGGLKLLGALGLEAGRMREDADYGDEPVVNPFREVGRNDPCPCGSGRKYKKCCLN